MTTPEQILVALLDGQATASALGDLLRIPELVARAELKRHLSAARVDSISCQGAVVFYHLTDTGREAAHKLKPAAV